RKRRVGLVLLAITVGASLITALLSVSTNIADKMTQELRSYGANIAVTPRSERIEIDLGGVVYSPPTGGSYIDERELVKLKTIFWRNNILGFVPSLSTQVRVGENRLPVALTGTWFDKEVRLPAGTTIRTTFADETVIREDISLLTGAKSVFSWWQVAGIWPGDADQESVLVGTSLAQQLQIQVGDTLPVEYEGNRHTFKVVGLVSTGSFEDDQIIGSLPLVQKLLGIPYGASRVMVSAMVQPKEKLAPEIRNKKPEEMTPREYEIWYCSPIVEAVSKQIEEVIPGSQARPIRQIAEAEGAFLVKIEWLITLITLVALTVSVLGVMATLHTAILERKTEIGLMKALGAQRTQIATLFILEASALGIFGGILGYLGGSFLAKLIGRQVFDSVIVPDSSFLPLALTLALAISLLGSGIPVWQATRVAPIKLMKGN
ncbi:MAG: ABC transporter permease, partial [Dehalococcoidales bacterium]|nr:ABC transporter permease [Dehalococcoidales bacterium]